jgi:hypothetical protein
LAFLLVASSVDAQTESPARPIPTPGTIMRLNQQHHAGDWLRVTLDSTRLELRARRIDAQGLRQITLRGHAAPPRDPIEWAMIDRIDVLRGRPVRGALVGILVGGVGAVAATRSGDFLIGGALAGAIGGIMLGRRMIHEEELYRAPPPSLVVMPAVVPAIDTTTTAPSLMDPDAADRVAREVAPGMLLRIHVTSGVRYGYVSTVDNRGLAGFRPEPSMEQSGAIDQIPWEGIYRIEKRAGSSGRGAKAGALTLGVGGGVVAGLLTLAVISFAGGEADASAAILGGVVGGAACAGIGALVGAGVGSAVPSWHVIYERR